MGKLLCLTIVLLLVNLVDVIAVQQVTIQPPTSIHDDGVGVMPDEQLFHSLNLNLPQLKTVKSYFESNSIYLLSDIFYKVKLIKKLLNCVIYTSS